MTETSKQNLKRLLNNFTKQNICNVLIQEFPEITWDEIQNQNVEENTKILSKANIIKLILNAVNNYSAEIIDERTKKLSLYYIGMTNRRTWNAFRLKDKIKHFDEKLNKLDSIKKTVRKAEMLADINVLKCLGKFIIKVVKQHTRKDRLVTSAPVYLQYFPFQPYIFISKVIVDPNLVGAVIEGLGYNGYDYCHLGGPNVRDLLQMLRNKDGGTSSAELIVEEPDLEPEVNIKDNVINYSQYKKRARYAEQIYGKNPPQLQQITATVKHDTWNAIDEFDAMKDVPIDGMELTIESANVVEFITEMMAKGLFVTPLPPYIANILSAGRNKIDINPLE